MAAGLSSRMGDFKPLMHMEGSTLIQNSIDSMLRAGVGTVTVVLGYRAKEVESLLRKQYPASQIQLAYNHDYAKTDMLHSIKIGVQALEPCDAFFLLPGDMPAVGKNTFALLEAARQQTQAQIVFPTLEKRRKHPPLISAQCRQAILRFAGEGGLRGLWAQYGDAIAEVPVDDIGCAIDTDTMADYIGCVQYMKQSWVLRRTSSNIS